VTGPEFHRSASNLVTYMIPIIEIEEYVTEKGGSPLRGVVQGPRPEAAAIITVGLARLAEGNTSKVEPIGEGASELKINRGPGYRVYFGRDGKALVILLGGGTKRRQSDDIADALAHWRNYKARKAKKAKK